MRKNRNKIREEVKAYNSNKKKHHPNFYPVHQRLAYLVLSIILLAYAIICVYYDDFVIQGRRKAIHLHTYPAWVMLLAFVATAANLLSFFIDHYDKRNNEHKYERFAEISKKVGWFFFVAALVLHIAQLF